MKKQSLTTSQERKMKYAEAGILVTLLLILTVFVGIKLSGNDEAQVAALDSGSPATDLVAPEAEFVTGEASVLEPTANVESAGENSVEIAEVQDVIAEPVAEIEPQPEAEPVSYSAAENRFHAGEFEEAAAMFSSYTDDHPANAWGFYMLGLSEWKAGDLDGAEDAFMQALELKPDHLKSLVNYGRVLIAMERHQEAREQVELALAANPGSREAVRVMGRINHNLGLLDEAAASYRTVLEFQGEDVWALNNLGLIYIEQEKFNEAVPPLAKASLLNPQIACIQNNLGVALERTGHYTAAGQAFARALEADSGYAKAETSLARVEGLTEAVDLIPIDLAALAEGFSTGQPDVAQFGESDMEVASALAASTPADVTAEEDDSRNR